jgi:hypothetical protein
MKAAPHLPYSPDLASADFYLFGYIKRCLASRSFESADELLETIRRILGDIEKVTFQAIFLEWMERLRKCLATNAEYVEQCKINVSERLIFILILVRCSRMAGTPSMQIQPIGDYFIVLLISTCPSPAASTDHFNYLPVQTCR